MVEVISVSTSKNNSDRYQIFVKTNLKNDSGNNIKKTFEVDKNTLYETADVMRTLIGVKFESEGDLKVEAKKIVEEIKNQFFTDLEGTEYSELFDSIKEKGQIYPIIIDEDGKIIDGNQRFKVCNELGIEPKVIVLDGLNDLQKANIAMDVNVCRRQLTKYDRQEALKKLRETYPSLSNRKIAEILNVDEKTIRKDLSADMSAKPEILTDSKAEAVPRLSQEVIEGKKSIREAAEEAGISKSTMERRVNQAKHQEAQKPIEDIQNSNDYIEFRESLKSKYGKESKIIDDESFNNEFNGFNYQLKTYRSYDFTITNKEMVESGIVYMRIPDISVWMINMCDMYSKCLEISSNKSNPDYNLTHLRSARMSLNKLIKNMEELNK